MRKKHFYPVPGAGSSAAMVCVECRRKQEFPFNQAKCQNLECPSHARKSVTDPSYSAITFAEDPVAQRVAEMVRGIEVAVPAQQGLGVCHKCC